MNGRPERLVLVLLLASVGLASGFGSDPASHGARDSLVETTSEADGRLIHYDFDSGFTPVVPNGADSQYEGSLRGGTENVSYLPQKGKLSVHFAGHPGSIAVSNSSSLSVRDGTTVGFWMRLDAEHQSNFVGQYGSYYFLIDGSTVTFVTMNGTEKLARPTADVPVGEWVYVAGSYDAERGARIFVNGELKDTMASSERPASPDQELVINMGGWRDGFRGAVDEFSVWNRSLTTMEVRAFYHGHDRAVAVAPPLRVVLSLFVLLAIVGVTAFAETR